MPYVYRLSHKSTGQFYIGYRKANETPSHIDLPEYKTSSDIITEMGFDNFDWAIVREFDNGEDAYWFEQRSIKENINNPLCLNKHYIDPDTGKRIFGFVGLNHTEESKSRMSYVLKGNTRSAKSWIVTGPDGTSETIQNMTVYCQLRGLNPSHMSQVARGKLPHHKGYVCAKL
jgi:hypothetical protein